MYVQPSVQHSAAGWGLISSTSHSASSTESPSDVQVCHMSDEF